MSATTTKPRRPKGKAHAQYLLPEELVKRIRVEAAERGVWPAVVVEERVNESYDNRPFQPADAASVG